MTVIILNFWVLPFCTMMTQSETISCLHFYLLFFSLPFTVFISYSINQYITHCVCNLLNWVKAMRPVTFSKIDYAFRITFSSYFESSTWLHLQIFLMKGIPHYIYIWSIIQKLLRKTSVSHQTLKLWHFGAKAPSTLGGRIMLETFRETVTQHRVFELFALRYQKIYILRMNYVFILL